MKRSWRIALTISVFFFLFCATTVNVYAAEQTGSASKESAEILFRWINFAIVAILILWVFGKLLPPVFRKNAETISSAITKATAAKAEAERQLREAEAKLARLEKEVAELRAAAQQESAAEEARIRTATQSDKEKIHAAAKAEVEAAEHAARIELKAIAAKLAVDGAESLLAKQLTAATQESLINNFVKSLDGRPN